MINAAPTRPEFATGRSRFRNRRTFALAGLCLAELLFPTRLGAQEAARSFSPSRSFFEMFRGDDYIGMGIVIVILLLSIALVALVIEYLITIRRTTLVPPGLAEQVHRTLSQGQVAQAEQLCKERPSFLSFVLQAGLTELRLGYTAAEKAMEDATQEQSTRLLRKIEYLAVIGNIAPMLGLLGTVWGMLCAFGDVPQEMAHRTEALAHDISIALWTTVLGLVVAIPALTAFAMFRNRVDQLAAECALLAEQVFAQYKRSRKTAQPPGREAQRAAPKPGT